MYHSIYQICHSDDLSNGKELISREVVGGGGAGLSTLGFGGERKHFSYSITSLNIWYHKTAEVIEMKQGEGEFSVGHFN